MIRPEREQSKKVKFEFNNSPDDSVSQKIPKRGSSRGTS
jgi:hypothetical protein